MCGITGFVSRSAPDRKVLEAMGNTIHHRGPDGEGYYVDDHCAIAHHRLSIIDLAGGSQPMQTADGRYIIAYNGEVYNFQELRKELQAEGRTFATNSDTEVILQGYAQWGVHVSEKLRGMFVFVIWDKVKQELYGARDPFGIKPMYYATMGDTFFFGSELKSFLPHPAFHKELNKDALKLYLTFQYSALTESFLKGVYRLLPGHYFLHRDGCTEFYSFAKLTFDPHDMPLEDRAKQILETVKESVKAHEISDVEVGSFLSGGIDSSLIAALSRPDKTYSVGFEREGFNETHEAEALCKEIGLKNYSKVITAQEFFDILPAIQYFADEPNANLSTVPLYFLSRLASQDVKVVLSGEGADELFAGYELYHTTKLFRSYKKLPKGIRKAAAGVAKKLPKFHGQGFLIKAAKDVREYFVGQAFIFDEDEAEKILKPEFQGGLTWRDVTAPYFDAVQDQDDLVQMQYLDLHLWQPLDILRKADRMTMANALELRVPYLDREVWAVARDIPSEQKMTGKMVTKVPLREAAKPVLPDEWINRPKKGFPVPFIAWLREEKYYNWAKDIIQADYTARFFDQKALLDMLDRHYSGKSKEHRKLYTVLSFLIWYRVYFPEECGAEPFVPPEPVRRRA